MLQYTCSYHSPAWFTEEELAASNSNHGCGDHKTLEFKILRDLQESRLTYSRTQPREAEELRKVSRALTAAPPRTNTVHPDAQEKKETCLSKEVLTKLQRKNFEALPREGISTCFLGTNNHVQWYRLAKEQVCWKGARDLSRQTKWDLASWKPGQPTISCPALTGFQPAETRDG